MSDILSLENLGAWVAQVTLLIGVGAVLPHVLKSRKAARFQLAYLQFLLAGCLLLPVLQPWDVPVRGTPKATAPERQNAVAAREPIPSDSIDLSIYAPHALLFGFAWRFGWLGLGILRLRRYRAMATPLDPMPEGVHLALRATGTTAAFAVSDEISGPVTFGWLKPAVLVTPEFGRLSETQQAAIACHELTHVRRRDWLVCLAEEAVAAVLWFQPAVWWLVRQIRLTREQVVDANVVRLIGSRDNYVEALLAMARSRWQLDLSPAPLFLSRRHLKSRIEHLLKETAMSRQRAYVSYGSMIALLAGTAWFGFTGFPLTATPQFESTRPPQQVEGDMRVLQNVELGSSLPASTRTALRERMAKYGGQPFSNELMRRVEKDARDVDKTLTFTWSIRPDGSIGLTLSHDAAAVGESQSVFAATAEKRIRISSGIAASKLKFSPKPEYPALAKLARQEGVVKMAVLIGKDGNVKEVSGLRGPFELQAAAEAAIRNWVYGTTLLNGQPVEVETTVDIPFHLP